MLRSLRARLTILIIILVLFPLSVVGSVLTLRSQQVQRDQAEEIEVSHARLLVTELQSLVGVGIQEMYILTEVQGLAGMSRNDQESVLFELMAYESSLNEIALLDASGKELIRQKRGEIVTASDLALRSDSSEFLVPFEQRIAYYSPVEISSTTGIPAMTMSIPVIDLRTDTVLNVLVAEFSLSKIWAALTADVRGEGHQSYIVDATGRLIAHQDPSIVLSGTTYRLPSAVGTSFVGETTGLSGDKVVMATIPYQFGDQVFTMVTERISSDALSAATETRNIMVWAILIAAVVVTAVATWLLTRLMKPLASLANVARRLGAGDFAVRAEEKGGSELVAVGYAFNDMAGQLANMVETLEQRISARTSDLQLASRLSSQISTILDPEELLPEVVDLTKSNFKLYHAHIYLLDTATNYLRLAAGSGDAGRIMRERGHRIALGANSLVARAARENTPVVVNNVLTDKNFLRNPLLPDTRSEASFPLSVRGRVVGVLDVQSDQENHFDRDLQSVLQTMAGQIAAAIVNAQLFSETEHSSRRESALSAIAESIQNATTLDDVLQTAARELGKALGVSQTSVELKLADTQGSTDSSTQS